MRLVLILGLILPLVIPGSIAAYPSDALAEQSSQQDSAAKPAPAPVPRGKKLMLKDGSFQLVRSYEKNGERVRYFSTERGAWEEIPASLVDWDATKKAEATDEKTSAALLEKVHVQEAAANAQTPVDVDVSLPVAPGVFLPDGEGMFALEGKSIKRLGQAGSEVRADKKTVLKQVLSPIPIVPSKHNIEIPGPKAAVRLTTTLPEFYLREPLPDPDKVSSLERTGRQSSDGPEVVLVRVKVKGNKRFLESIRSLFGTEISQDRDEISIQRWEVAPDIYRFTLSAPLPAGEYAMAEILDDGMNLFVWDFGVDATALAPASKAAAH
jgi:hypothetical protein